jgi:hypothetical protein
MDHCSAKSMIKLTIITYVTALPRTGEMDHQRLPE